MERLRDDKAAGADELAPRFPNSIKGSISCPLTLPHPAILLFQKLLQDEEVPDNWHEADVVPVFKGGDRRMSSSLISQISKIFESIGRDEIIAFLERFEVIRDRQLGFRKENHVSQLYWCS